MCTPPSPRRITKRVSRPGFCAPARTVCTTSEILGGFDRLLLRDSLLPLNMLLLKNQDLNFLGRWSSIVDYRCLDTDCIFPYIPRIAKRKPVFGVIVRNRDDAEKTVKGSEGKDFSGLVSEIQSDISLLMSSDWVGRFRLFRKKLSKGCRYLRQSRSTSTNRAALAPSVLPLLKHRQSSRFRQSDRQLTFLPCH